MGKPNKNHLHDFVFIDIYMEIFYVISWDLYHTLSFHNICQCFVFPGLGLCTIGHCSKKIYEKSLRRGRGIKLIDQVNFYFIYTGDLCFLCVIIDYAVIFDIITYTLKDLSFKALSSPQNGTAMLQYHFLLYDQACHSLNDVYSLNKFHSTCGFDTISGGYHCLDRLIILPTN